MRGSAGTRTALHRPVSILPPHGTRVVVLLAVELGSRLMRFAEMALA